MFTKSYSSTKSAHAYKKKKCQNLVQFQYKEGAICFWQSLNPVQNLCTMKKKKMCRFGTYYV